jgi:hypothetical protein
MTRSQYPARLRRFLFAPVLRPRTARKPPRARLPGIAVSENRRLSGGRETPSLEPRYLKDRAMPHPQGAAQSAKRTSSAVGWGYARKLDSTGHRRVAYRSSLVGERGLRPHHRFAVTRRVVTNPESTPNHSATSRPTGRTRMAVPSRLNTLPRRAGAVFHPVETPGASGWEGRVDTAARAGTHVLGHNWTATVEGRTRKRTSLPRKRATVNSPSGNPRPQPRPQAEGGRGGCQELLPGTHLDEMTDDE